VSAKKRIPVASPRVSNGDDWETYKGMDRCSQPTEGLRSVVPRGGSYWLIAKKKIVIINHGGFDRFTRFAPIQARRGGPPTATFCYSALRRKARGGRGQSERMRP